jgi:hypothetical protein
VTLAHQRKINSLRRSKDSELNGLRIMYKCSSNSIGLKLCLNPRVLKLFILINKRVSQFIRSMSKKCTQTFQLLDKVKLRQNATNQCKILNKTCHLLYRWLLYRSHPSKLIRSKHMPPGVHLQATMSKRRFPLRPSQREMKNSVSLQRNLQRK